MNLRDCILFGMAISAFIILVTMFNVHGNLIIDGTVHVCTADEEHDSNTDVWILNAGELHTGNFNQTWGHVMINATSSLWCNTSVTVNMSSLTINSGGTLEATSGTLTFVDFTNYNDDAGFVHNNGDVVINAGSWDGIRGDETHFHNVTIAQANIGFWTDVTIEDTLTVNGRFQRGGSATTLTLGTNSSSGTINGLDEEIYLIGDTHIHGRNEDYPVSIDSLLLFDIATGTNYFKWVDFNVNVDTSGTYAETIQLDGDCNFSGVEIASGDTLNLQTYNIEVNNLTLSNSSTLIQSNLSTIYFQNGTYTDYEHSLKNVTVNGTMYFAGICNFTKHFYNYGSIYNYNNDSQFILYGGSNSFTNTSNMTWYNFTNENLDLHNLTIFGYYYMYGNISNDFNMNIYMNNPFTVHGFSRFTGLIKIFNCSFENLNVTSKNEFISEFYIYNCTINNFYQNTSYDYNCIFEQNNYIGNLTLISGDTNFSNNYTINGTVLHTEGKDNDFYMKDNYTLNGYHDLNPSGNYDFKHFNIHGKLEFDNYSYIAESCSIDFDYIYNLMNSTGEINITANINYPLVFEGQTFVGPLLTGHYINIFDVTNLSDYHFTNVIFRRLTNQNNEYITFNGLEDTLVGNWDSLPPLINILELNNNSILYKEGSNNQNISFYSEELSYIHSYNLTITKKSNDVLYYSKQYNFSSPVNSTYFYKILNFTYYPLGDYWYNLTVYDTHNKLSKEAKYKKEAKNLKVKINDKHAGYYDNETLYRIKGKTLIFYDLNNPNIELFTIEFMNNHAKETLNSIIFNRENLNFKQLYEVYLEKNEYSAQIKLTGNNIILVENYYGKNWFVINDKYYYDVNDFSGNVSISHIMKNQNKEYFLITFYSDNWNNTINTDRYIKIDPLSGLVNNNFTSYSFTISQNESLNSVSIGFITPNPIYEGNTSIFNATTTGLYNISKYIWVSSIDGEFYNSSNSEFSNNNLSVGNHIITLKGLDEYGFYTASITSTYYVYPIPTAKINYVYIIGNEVKLSGGYVKIINNTIVRYAWRSNIQGEFYNGTINPISVLGLDATSHIIYFKILDSNGTWSSEQSININLTNVTVTENPDSTLWFETESGVYTVSAGIIIIILVAVMFIYFFKNYWQGRSS